MITRRGLIRGIAGAGLASLLIRNRGRGKAFAQSTRGSQRPRYFVNIIMGGGVDPVYTADPKTRSEVDKDIDIPFEASEITQAAGLKLGPHWRPLAPIAADLLVLRGVHVGTANHEMGLATAVRMRTAVELGMPSVIDV